MKVLIVDDDRALRDALRRTLVLGGYETCFAADGEDALAQVAAAAPDAVVLDVGLPDIDGLEVSRRLRAAGNRVPILMLTARDAIEDRIDGLDAGADDYLVKPFEYDELLARVRALLRRRQPGGREILHVADLVMDVAAHEVRRGNRVVELTALQFNLLEHFLRHARQVLEREQLLESVWGIESDAISNVVDVTIADLRARLEAEHEPRLLHTVRGVGYVLKEP